MPSCFDPDGEDLGRFVERYRTGGVGDVMTKKRLDAILEDILAPMREEKRRLMCDPGHLVSILYAGTMTAIAKAAETLAEIKRHLGIPDFGALADGRFLKEMAG